MAMPAKSDALHKLHGTKSEAKDPTASLVAGGRPRFPKGISAEAKAVYKQLVRLLEARKTLTSGDESLLHLFAATWNVWRKAQDRVDAEGAVIEVTLFAKGG